MAAAEQVEAAQVGVADPQAMAAVVADKGYHSNQTVVDLDAVRIRSSMEEPDRGRRLMRQRGARIARSFAHLSDTGGMRRPHLRGHENMRKRLLIHAGAFNLGSSCGTRSAWARRGGCRAALPPCLRCASRSWGAADAA